MTMREEMRSLGQEIIGSYETRAAGIATLRQAARDQLQEFHKAHQAMARKQRADLAKSTANLKRDVNTMLKRVRTELAGARDEWQKLTATMRAKRRAPIVAGVKAGSEA
jgi:predicted  nucleic acid-binding Zn-ribbon protein